MTGCTMTEDLRIKVTRRPLSVERCRRHPENYYLFGDNLQKRGKGGQAIIRDEPNAVGIPTKYRPAMTLDAFFSDAFYEQNVEQIIDAIMEIPKGSRVVVHYGIGSGRAQLPMRAPETYAFLCELLGMDNIFKKT